MGTDVRAGAFSPWGAGSSPLGRVVTSQSLERHMDRSFGACQGRSWHWAVCVLPLGESHSKVAYSAAWIVATVASVSCILAVSSGND